MIRPIVPILVLAVAMPLAGRAGGRVAPQDTAPEGGQPPVFKAEANLVVLDVNVFDGHSDAVPQLPQSAFTVVEDGRPQTITFFTSTDVPVAVGLVVDNSTSMLTRHGMVLAGSRAFAESSHPDDEAFSVVFNEHVRFGNPGNAPFTTSPAQLQAGLHRYPAGGLTALYDAVIEALDHLQDASLQKRVLIVLSDGEDNASSHSEADMLHRARRSDAMIYTISTADLSSHVGNASTLKKLAAQNGGVAYFPDTEKRVVEAFSEVAQNIRRGYRIGYTPTNPAADGEYHRVKVMVRMPGRKLSVRARDGYTAGSDPLAR